MAWNTIDPQTFKQMLEFQCCTKIHRLQWDISEAAARRSALSEQGISHGRNECSSIHQRGHNTNASLKLVTPLLSDLLKQDEGEVTLLLKKFVNQNFCMEKNRFERIRDLLSVGKWVTVAWPNYNYCQCPSQIDITLSFVLFCKIN